MEQFTPKEYLKIDIANHFGLDKLNWDKRLDWFDKNEGNLEALSSKADVKPLYDKGVYTYRNIDKPTGYLCGLDSTSSNLQMFAILTGCRETAKKVNLIYTGNREDVYSTVVKSNLTRDIVKKPFMTYWFGSRKQPEKLLGKGSKFLKEFYNKMEKEYPGAYEARNILISLWDPDALTYEWTMPDGFEVLIKVYDVEDKRIEADELKVVGNKSTFVQRITINKPVEKGVSLSANLIHSVDSYVVREMIRMSKKQGFDLLTIHDNFLAHPKYMQRVRENYIHILAEISKSNLLSDIIVKLGGKPYKKKSDDLYKDILKSEYALS